jgi:hypothetical protein
MSMVIEGSYSNISFEMQKPQGTKLCFIQLTKWVRASKEIIIDVDLCSQTFSHHNLLKKRWLV